jgi:ATP-binding cassette subfamily B protein
MGAVRKLAAFAKPYWRWVLLAPVLMLLEVVMDLLQPRMMQRIIDEGIALGNMRVLFHTGLAMLGFALVGAVGGISNGYYTTKAQQGFAADLREAVFRKVQSLSFANLDRLETGQLITRLTNDITQVSEVLYMLLRILIRAPLLLVGSLVMSIVTSPQLAFIPFALMPLLLVVVAWVVKKATPMYSVVQTRLDALNGVMQENLAGARVVKAFVRAEHEEKRFDETNYGLVDQSIRVARLTAVTMPIMMFLMNLGVAAVLWYGGVRITQNGMQVGQIVAFINYLSTTLMSLMMVSMMVVQVARAQASALRIEEVLESQPVVQTKPDALKAFAPQGRVAFEHVTFGYHANGDGSDAALHDISFVAEPGETVALVGTTGSGKSSLVHLIPRFYDVDDGRVTIDGIDVRDVDETALRRRIGVALQETVLFSGTIRDNIRYGRPEATHEEVVAAAKLAQAHDFVMSFPDGYDSAVGQRGMNLSGGQKQRLAVARALLIQPAVLILDDSTSSVDTETEVRLQEALKDYMRGRTAFVIAQRISSVMHADKILVMDNGRIVGQGTHSTLLVTNPIYREICASQLGNGEGTHD